MKSNLFKALCIFCAISFLGLFVSCSKTSKQTTKSLKSTAMVMADRSAPMYADSKMSNDIAISEETSTSTERKLIKTGYINMLVTDLSEAEKETLSYCENLGGYVSNSSKSDMSLSIDVKIPQDKFDEAIDKFSSIGKINNKNISSDDVSENYYDLAGRIETKKILEERLTSYLKKATNMSDLVAIEKQLNNVQTELESMQGRLKRLDNQIDYSRITVSFALPSNKTTQGTKWPSISEKFSKLMYAFVDFLEILLVVIIGIVIFGVPCVLLIALLFYLTFGKVGLVRKLFSRLKK